jgi:hypothetical protein
VLLVNVVRIWEPDPSRCQSPVDGVLLTNEDISFAGGLEAQGVKPGRAAVVPRRERVRWPRAGEGVYGAAVSPAVRSIFGVVLVLAVASPVVRHANDDSFPLSTYPMFARVLTQPRLVYAEGLQRGGLATRLPPELVANDEPMQAMRTLKQAANGGKRELKRLCAAIAERAAARAEYAGLRRVRIVSATFDPVRYFEAGPAPESSERLVECAVPR